MVRGQRVLVVDGLTETEEVLKAVLEPRGLQVDRVRGHDNAYDYGEPIPPHVVVIDLDESSPTRGCTDNWERVPRVIIGSAEITDGNSAHVRQQYLRKPFQYAELIQAIEGLLADPSR